MRRVELMNAVSLLALGGGLPAPLAGRQNVLPSPARSVFHADSTPRCKCGKAISRNKRFCLKCGVEEAKKEGLIQA